MLTRHCEGTCAFLIFAFSSLLIFLPVETFAKNRNLYFAESSSESLKNPDEGATNDRSPDTQIRKRPTPHLRSKRSTLKKSAPGKPDIVLTDTLELSLRDVIAHTLKNNVAIAVQDFQSKIRKEEIITQESVFDPTLSVEGNATQEKQLSSFAVSNPVTQQNTQRIELSLEQKLKLGTQYELKFRNDRVETDSNFAALSPQYNSRFEVNLTQPLLKNFGLDINKSSIYIANNNLDISDFDFKNKVIEVVADTENVYWNLVFSREDLKVQQKSVERAKDLERRVKAQVDVGTMAPIEILQAKSEVASREEAVIQAHKLIQDNQDNLKNILNIPFDSPEGLKEIQPLDSPRFLVETPVSLRDSILTAIKNRPDYLKKRKELNNKHIQVKFNENQLYPTLDLVASFGLNGISGRDVGVSPFSGAYGRDIERTFSGDASTWEGGFLFKYPLGNREAESRLAVSKLETSQLLMNIKDLEKTIVVEVREAVRLINTTKKRVQAARVARKLAEEKLSAEEKKFEVGLSISINPKSNSEKCRRPRWRNTIFKWNPIPAHEEKIPDLFTTEPSGGGGLVDFFREGKTENSRRNSV
jgi:outer membrane protein TolC